MAAFQTSKSLLIVIWPNHPPLKGEGRTAEGSPGWGGGGAPRDTDAEFAARLSPPPGPLARADLPPPGGGEDSTCIIPHASRPIASGPRLQCGEFPIALKRHPGAGEACLFDSGLGVVGHAA